MIHAGLMGDREDRMSLALAEDLAAIARRAGAADVEELAELRVADLREQLAVDATGRRPANSQARVAGRACSGGGQRGADMTPTDDRARPVPARVKAPGGRRRAPDPEPAGSQLEEAS